MFEQMKLQLVGGRLGIKTMWVC